MNELDFDRPLCCSSNQIRVEVVDIATRVKKSLRTMASFMLRSKNFLWSLLEVTTAFFSCNSFLTCRETLSLSRHWASTVIARYIVALKNIDKVSARNFIQLTLSDVFVLYVLRLAEVFLSEILQVLHLTQAEIKCPCSFFQSTVNNSFQLYPNSPGFGARASK